MMMIHYTDTVRPDQASVHAVDGINNPLFKQGARFTFLMEACRKNDKGTGIFLSGQQFNCIRAEFGGNGKNRQITIGQVFRISVAFDPLDFIFFGIGDINIPGKMMLQKVFKDFSAWLGCAVATRLAA